MMQRVTPAQMLLLFGILTAFCFLTSLAIAKWQYERRMAQKKKEAAEAKRPLNP